MQATDQPEHIGPYRILGVLGEGGIGLVYLAEQTEPVRRRVALKVIKVGMDTRQEVARFASERKALAVMDHPNIAHARCRVADNGRPYFVMETRRACPSRTTATTHRLSTDERTAVPRRAAIQHLVKASCIAPQAQPVVGCTEGKPPEGDHFCVVAQGQGHR
jgi:non-specific serine/threonine protein kinase/serine/threonine-protein kinase